MALLLRYRNPLHAKDLMNDIVRQYDSPIYKIILNEIEAYCLKYYPIHTRTKYSFLLAGHAKIMWKLYPLTRHRLFCLSDALYIVSVVLLGQLRTSLIYHPCTCRISDSMFPLERRDIYHTLCC